jgi:hypothetical protein
MSSAISLDWHLAGYSVFISTNCVDQPPKQGDNTSSHAVDIQYTTDMHVSKYIDYEAY